MVVHFFKTAEDVGGGVTLGMPDVEAGARRIGEHIQDVVLRLRGIEVVIAWVRGAERLMFLPVLLPLGFKIGEWKWFTLVGHGEREVKG